MGQVLRATDPKLNRRVAIKILPPSLAADDDRRVGFQCEAHVLAALNHANIAAIDGMERSGLTIALVMELVERPTLTDRVGQGCGTQPALSIHSAACGRDDGRAVT